MFSTLDEAVDNFNEFSNSDGQSRSATIGCSLAQYYHRQGGWQDHWRVHLLMALTITQRFANAQELAHVEEIEHLRYIMQDCL